MQPIQYVIYGSGDKNTAELLDAFFQKGIAVEFRDLRARDAEGNLANLAFIQSHRFFTVPQVFTANGTHLGEYDAGMRLIERRPFLLINTPATPPHVA